MLAGRKDALSLTGIAAGLGATVPLAAASPYVAMAGMGASLAGSTWLGWKHFSRRREARVYAPKKEGFILHSDPVPKECYGQGGYRLGLTRDLHKPVDIEDDLAMRHTAIIGQSGVGKTVLGESMLWQQTARGGGWLFVDAKLDRGTRDHLAAMMRILGREDDFLVLDSSDAGNSNYYNPILRGSGDEVASRLMNLLPVAEDNPGADHYRQAANYALSVIVSCLKACNMVYHFGDLSILLQSPSALADLERRTAAAGTRQGHEAARGMQVFLDQYRAMTKSGPQIDMKRIKDTLGGMAGRIATFAQGDFGAVMNHVNPDIDLTDAIMNNKCVYMMLPTMAKDTAALNLGKMIVSDLRSSVAEVQDLPEYRRPNPPFMAFLDEMGSYVLYGVKTLFEQARSAQICMMPGFQAFANLAVVTEDFAEIIIQNTWNKALFKFGSKDAELAADLLGKINRLTESLTEGDNTGSSMPLVRMGPDQQQSDATTYGVSYRAAEEYRIGPNKLMSLGKGECILQSGARQFHIAVPMVVYPQDLPPYQVIRRNPDIARNMTPAPYNRNYYNFLSATEIEQVDKEQKTEQERMAKEEAPIKDRLASNSEAEEES